MSSSTDLVINRPVSILNREIELDLKDFFTNLTKAAVAGSFNDLKGAMEYGVDALAATGILKSPEQAAWALVSTSLNQAILNLSENYRDLFTTEIDADAIEDLAERVEHTLNSVTVNIDKSFFVRPQGLPLLEDFKSAIVFWLEKLGLDSHQACAFHYRLKGEFVLALHKQWSAKSETYKSIDEKLDTPFVDQTLSERSWQQYNLKLQTSSNQRVFDEAFSLKQVYIPLRASYKVKSSDNLNMRHEDDIRFVCDLHAEIKEWLTQFDKDCALRVISGGPGSGKSSFAKILVADLSVENEIPVLFIPLHYFNITDNLVESIANFAQSDELNNPLVGDYRKDRLLLVFDGLDELSMQGKAATDAALHFIDELSRVLDRHNENDTRWQALVTGRELSVQASETRLREHKQILHVLPYYLTEEEKERYQDEGKMLETDQRNLWWNKYAEAKGLSYENMPSELDTDHLQPITREPLLNYLLSLSYERKTISFSDKTSLNNIYFDLLQAVHERQYAGRQHEASKHLTFTEFLEILEEIALAVWHGNGRTASESYLLERCERGGLLRHIEEFSRDAKAGVVSLLTAFYFRQFGTEPTGDRTFEFTHKSFGEYLTARRIVEAVKNLCDERSRNKRSPRTGWTVQKALQEWVNTTGQTKIDSYLINFIKDEIAQEKTEDIHDYHETISELLCEVIRDGSPMESVGLTRFSEMLEHSNNAEMALLVVHHCCTLKTKTVLKNKWGAADRFGAWLKRIQGQRTGNDSGPTHDALTYINLSGQTLYCAELFKANLSYSNLLEVRLDLAILYQANLRGANLERARLLGANLESANLEAANLKGAILIDANLKKADLKDAVLEGARLQGANLEGASLEGANLEDANLEGAKLEDCNLKNTILEKTE